MIKIKNKKETNHGLKWCTVPTLPIRMYHIYIGSVKKKKIAIAAKGELKMFKSKRNEKI